MCFKENTVIFIICIWALAFICTGGTLSNYAGNNDYISESEEEMQSRPNSRQSQQSQQSFQSSLVSTIDIVAENQSKKEVHQRSGNSIIRFELTRTLSCNVKTETWQQFSFACVTLVTKVSILKCLLGSFAQILHTIWCIQFTHAFYVE